MKVKLVAQIVDKNAVLGLELRTLSKVAIGFKSEEKLESGVGSIEELENFKKKILEQFAMYGRELGKSEYLNIYIEEADDIEDSEEE